jgi:hypothetical protein
MGRCDPKLTSRTSAPSADRSQVVGKTTVATSVLATVGVAVSWAIGIQSG